MQPANGADGDPDPKRPRLLEDPLQQPQALAGGAGVDAGAAAGELQPARPGSEEQPWSGQWAEVFSLMQQSDMEARAGEYAEAVVALKKNAESLLRQRMTVQRSCEQLLSTAYREALQSHLKAMLEAASTGASQELLDAARRSVDELLPAEPLPQAAQKPGLGPPLQGKQMPLGAGAAQPGVVLPPLLKAPGLLGLPSKAASAAGGNAAASKAQGLPQPGGLAPPLGQAGFSEIGQFDLWVGGLPDGIDEGMFRTLFGRYGNIVSVKLLSDKRVGFVKFSTKEQSQAAVDALNGFECNGMTLSVKFADNKGLNPTGSLGVNPFGISLPGAQMQS